MVKQFSNYKYDTLKNAGINSDEEDDEEEEEIIIDSQPLMGKVKKRGFSKNTKNGAPKLQKQLEKRDERKEGICSSIWEFFTCGGCESNFQYAQVILI